MLFNKFSNKFSYYMLDQPDQLYNKIKEDPRSDQLGGHTLLAGSGKPPSKLCMTTTVPSVESSHDQSKDG